jgi:hypothetical protein
LSETLHNQMIGLDAVSLLLVAPVSVVMGVLARRGHRAAPHVAVAIGAYTAYMFVQYIVGPSYLDYPRVLPLQLGLFIIGWAAALQGWILGRTSDELPTLGSSPRRHAIALFAFAAFVILRYVPVFAGVVTGDPIPADAIKDPAMFWTIVLMDLGIRTDRSCRGRCAPPRAKLGAGCSLRGRRLVPARRDRRRGDGHHHARQ